MPDRCTYMCPDCPSNLLAEVSVGNDGSVVEEWMVEAVGSEIVQLHYERPHFSEL